MLRAVVVSHHDDHEYDLEMYSSVGLTMQMFKRAMYAATGTVDYQAEPHRVYSAKPHLTLRLTDMSPARRATATHDLMTRVVTLEGLVTFQHLTRQFKCVATMNSDKWAWEAQAVSLDIGTEHYEYVFRPVQVGRVIRYQISPRSGDEGPQPAKV